MSDATLRRLRIGLILLGLALSGYLVTESQVAGDQLSFLARGWLLAFEGDWVPYGLLTSSGGKNPGALTSLLSGLPMLVWQDHHAPTVVLWLCHLAAFLVLLPLFRRSLTPLQLTLFVLLFWFSPWRLYYSSFAWTPNYMVPMGALYTWTLFALRRDKRLGWSVLHVVAIGLALQIHASFFLLVVASLVLYWRKYLRLHLGGAALGGAVVLATLAPWLAAVVEDPSLLPAGGGMPGRGLLLVFPVIRALGYWVRYSSLAVGNSFFALEGATASLVPVLLALTAAPALWANLRLWRGQRGRWWREATDDLTEREWLSGATRWVLLAVLATAGLSPTTIMSWQLLPFFHFAVLPLVFAGGDLLEKRARGWARGAVAAYVALSLAVVGLVISTSPMHRCGGLENGYRHTVMPELRTDHRIFDDLGIRDSCAPIVDNPEGWWTDVLPETGREGETTTDEE